MCIWRIAGVRCPQGNKIRKKKSKEGYGMAVKDAALYDNAQMSEPCEKRIEKNGFSGEAAQ